MQRMQYQPKSLFALSNDKVLRDVYYFDDERITKTFIKSTYLISTEDVRKLQRDPDLIREIRRNVTSNVRPQNVVLHYLIVEKPESGMFYGALYAIQRLFYVAHESYLEQHKINDDDEERLKYKELMAYTVTRGAIGGGDIHLYNACVKYASPEYERDDNFGMSCAIEYGNMEMVDFFLTKEISLERALHSATFYEKIHIIMLLIDKCHDANLGSYINACFIGAIHEHKKDSFNFFLYGYFGDINLNNAFREIISYNRREMFHKLLECIDDTDIDMDNLFGLAVVYNRLYFVRVLLQRHVYPPYTLRFWLTIIIDKSQTIEQFQAHKAMIGELISQIPPFYFDRVYKTQLLQTTNRELYAYLYDRWNN